jgi:putative transposase
MRKISCSSQDASVNRGGQRPALKEQHVLVLREIVAEQPALSLEAVTALLEQRCGVRVCSLTVRRAPAAAGVVRAKPTRRASAAEPAARPQRYGYAAEPTAASQTTSARPLGGAR